MQEQVNQKTIALSIKTAKLTAEVLKKAIQLYLKYHKEHKATQHGRTTVRKLMGENAGAASIEVTDGNIKDFSKVASKYNIDFAVKKDKTSDIPKYLVFFKARDTDAINQAFKEYVKNNERKTQRVSVKERLQHYQKLAEKLKNRERVKEKVKSRGREL